MDQEHDAVKDMNTLVAYAKTAKIRNIQIEEHKRMESEYRQQKEKMDLMMEIERLKEIKFQEEKERKRKEEQRLGALVVVDQIKERELDRLRQKDLLEREKILMNRQIKELEEEDKRAAEVNLF